jgi:hypothetical protein
MNGTPGTISLAIEPNGDVVTLETDGQGLYCQTYNGPQLQSYSTNGAQVAPFISSTVAEPDGSSGFNLIEKLPAAPNRGAIGLTSLDVYHSSGDLYAC